jgi:hypothetical protein
MVLSNLDQTALKPLTNDISGHDASGLNVPPAIMHTSELEQDFHFELQEKDHKPLPADLQGHCFFIAPVGSLEHQYGKGEPLFNGCGRLYRVDLNRDGQLETPGKAAITSKLTRPLCFKADQLTQQDPLMKFRDVGLARLSPQLGFYNELNTAFLPFRFQEDAHDRLMVTWDVGRPYEVDPLSLELFSPIGTVEDWVTCDMQSQWMFPLIFSSAHPVADPVNRRDVFTVQYGGLTLNLPSLAVLHPEAKTRDQMRQFLLAAANLHAPHGALPAAIAESLTHLLRLPAHESHQHIQLLREQLQRLLQSSQSMLQTLWAEFKHQAYDNTKELIQKFHHSLEALPHLQQAHGETIAAHGKLMDDHAYVLRWDGGQHLQRWTVFHEQNGQVVPVHINQTMHQIGLTQDYIVLMDTAFKMGLEGVFNNPFPEHPEISHLIQSLLAKPQHYNTVLYLIRRADLHPENDQVMAKRVELPREAAHYVVDYANPNQQITIHLVHNCASDPAEWVRPYEQSAIPGIDYREFDGMLVGPTDVNMVGRYVVNAETGMLVEGQQITADETWGLALYTGLGAFTGTENALVPQSFDDMFWISWGCMGLQPEEVLKLYKAYPYRQLPIGKVLEIARNPDRPETHSHIFRVQSSAAEKLKIADRYQFANVQIVNSPQFIPRAGAVSTDIPVSRNGYLICNVITGDNTNDNMPNSDDTRTHEIWIFDAANLAQGPMYRLSHPDLCFGFTLHTAWLSQLQSLEPMKMRNYIDPREDFSDRIKDHTSPAIQKLMQELFNS